jgi:hypothetical protein
MSESWIGETSGQLAALLEDFEVVGTRQHIALMRHDSSKLDRQRVRAGLVASTLGLNSLDYARRRYCRDDHETEEEEENLLRAYVNAYRSAKSYIFRMLKKLQPEGLPQPSAGEFTSSVALERLPASFFSAHLLYRLGYRFEGHAVSRLALEQIAWAYAAFQIDDIDRIERIDTTKAVSVLKRVAPEAGRLYGFLSSKTHIDFSSHLEFISIEQGQNVVWFAHPRYLEFAEVILTLADLFGIAWEISQFRYIPNPESVFRKDAQLAVNDDRPFLREKEHLLSILRKLSEEIDAPPDRPRPLA